LPDYFTYVLDIGWKEISNYTAKLKPYLIKALESSGRALNEFAQTLADI